MRKLRAGQKLPDGVLLDAVALCEVKRDSSDLGNAVVKNTEVMSWLSGDRSGYDPSEWVNKHHPLGHFGLAADGVTERAHALTSQGVTYLFDRASFSEFRPSGEQAAQPGSRLPSRLHIVTSARRRAVRPVCSKVFARLQHKAARDVALVGALVCPEAADAYDWEGLREWLRGMSGPLSPYGALALFDEDAAAAERLHVELLELDTAAPDGGDEDPQTQD